MGKINYLKGLRSLGYFVEVGTWYVQIREPYHSDVDGKKMYRDIAFASVGTEIKPHLLERFLERWYNRL